MHLHSYRIKNYRRLRNVHIELASDISIFVGSNNSGKTSATQAICAFLSGEKDKLSLYDFSSACWKDFDEYGNAEEDHPKLPSISVDLWFEVAASDLYLVIPLVVWTVVVIPCHTRGIIPLAGPVCSACQQDDKDVPFFFGQLPACCARKHLQPDGHGIARAILTQLLSSWSPEHPPITGFTGTGVIA